MKTFLLIIATASLAWIVCSFVHGLHAVSERMWLISAVKAPGRMAMDQIVADMNAGEYDSAKEKLRIMRDRWEKFDRGPQSFEGPGIGEILVDFAKLNTGREGGVPATGTPAKTATPG